MVTRGSRAALLLAAAIAAPVAAQHADWRLEDEFEPAQVYVQAQTIYRLRLYQGVDLRNLKINPPSARLADLRPLGADRVYEAQRDGRRYRVHERSYLVFPFSSGRLEFSGAHVSASRPADSRQTLRLDAPPRTLTVLPAPAAAGAMPWLPARSLSLSESWAPTAAEIRTGQALRRTIRIEAAGVDAAQIPPLQLAAAGMLIEAEPPRLENRLSGELNIGVREQSFSLVPQRTGQLQLPPVQLGWWNVATNTADSATLPARSLRIAAADAEPALGNMPPIPKSLPATPEQPLPWPALLPAAAALLLSSLALAYCRRPQVRAGWRLRRACRTADAAALRDALLQWAAALWPQTPPLTLTALAERLPDQAAHHALASIERGLYGPASGPDTAAALAAAARIVQRGHRRWRRKCRQPSRQAPQNPA